MTFGICALSVLLDSSEEGSLYVCHKDSSKKTALSVRTRHHVVRRSDGIGKGRRKGVHRHTILVSCTGCRRRISAYCFSLFSSSSYPRGVYTVSSSVREADAIVKRFLVTASTPHENETNTLRKTSARASVIHRKDIICTQSSTTVAPPLGCPTLSRPRCTCPIREKRVF